MSVVSTQPLSAALRDADAMFRGAFEYAPGGIGLATLEDLCWTEVNPALCALLGHARHELLGTSFAELTHPEALEVARQVRAGEIPVYETDKRYLHADGHVIWVSLLVSLLRDAQSAPRCFIVQVFDITARMAAEDAKALSERGQADAQANGDVGSWAWDVGADDVTRSDQLAGVGCGEKGTILEGFMALAHEQDLARVALARVAQTVEQAHEAGVSESEERFRLAFDAAPIGMALVSLEGRFTRVNDALCEILGYPEAGLTELTFQDITHANGLGADEDLVRQLIAGERLTYRMHERYLHAEGRIVWAELNVSLARDAAGQPMYFISQIQDITERKQLEERLQDMARRDHLTGLYNRRGFEEELERELANARRFERRGALLMLDLDGFKAVNDTLGHRAGDEMLSGIARMLEEQLRRNDILGRLGGDEFAIVLTETSREHARTVVGSLEKAFASEAQHGQHVHTTASIGFVMFDGELGVEDLLGQADEAMYAQKRAAQV